MIWADLSPVSPELLESMVKSRFSSGDNSSKTGDRLLETRDKLSKYGDRFSFSGDRLCSPELPELFFSIFIEGVFVKHFLCLYKV